MVNYRGMSRTWSRRCKKKKKKSVLSHLQPVQGRFWQLCWEQYRWNPVFIILSAHSWASVPVSSVGLQRSEGHCEFQTHVLFWCFVWVLYRREGILVFPVTDRPCCLEKHNYSSHCPTCCSQIGPYGPHITARGLVKRKLLAAINHFTV